MQTLSRAVCAVSSGLIVFILNAALAQDWPQWRGPGRDAKATFTPPATWPKELTQKWDVPVGSSDATPALVGNKLYVFTREGAQEVLRCLDAAEGKELWRDGYDALPPDGPAGRHPGPRSSPTVAAGKVVTYGARGTLSCLDAATGRVLWRKDGPLRGWPRFYTSSSPIVVENLCIAQVGKTEEGGIVAFDLASGAESWQWTGDGPAYASPVLLTADGATMVVALTGQKIVGLRAADGKLLWESPFAPQGRSYNAATPIVDGRTVIYCGAGRGTKAVQLAQQGEGFAAKELWSNPDHAVQFNTPVLHDGRLYGLSQRGDLFCLDATSGRTAWTHATGERGGFGSVISAGPVLMALGPSGQLVVFQPDATEYKELASYKVADSDTYAHPVVAGRRIFVQDQNSVTLWSVE
jgi:outer membrane protein assembly factor BamB